MRKLVLGLLLMNLLVACAVPNPNKVNDSSQRESVTGAVLPTTKSIKDDSVISGVIDADVEEQNNYPNGLPLERSVYYPLDVSDVQPDDMPVVQAHARYLNEHANSKVRLEGNCDERGSDEYNLALGQRRADKLKKLLQISGVQESQIETVSNGSMKPKAAGHDESSWSQNRRADLNYE